MEKNEIIKKIISIDDLSQSQLDRLNLQNEAYADLIGFLHNAIEKIKTGTNLRRKLETEIDKLITPDENDPDKEIFSPNQLLNLFSILLKYDSEQSIALIGALKDSIKININNGDSDRGNTIPVFPSGNNSEVDKQNIQDAKRLLSLSNALEKAEISFDELEDLIKNRKK